ncbi:twin-arginine translocase subunit TatC [Roseisolibacter sp. H3M3-2]|uniref:twin-arginine translocase subunit TatC n=1 Tax=Roseisolibacter sp. H3M3-2 TaxID=3031323 RepID=UPI0023DC5E92|nr:twin-arginine translocase subunit TatC [Roseisolibacter sp. H3M3-2]MDF1506300.1 twin-arginine translocase subunit TatC [Roseisolibacter sp. H3M3-2]
MTHPTQNPGEMPFLDHLEELRWRLVWSLAAFIIALVLAFALVSQVDIIGWLERPVLPLLGGKKLVYTSPTDPFSIVLNASFALGLLLASPIIGYQLWSFLSPALYRHEKRIIIPVLAGGIVLFLLGASLSHFIVLPFTLKFLLGFQSAAIEPMLTVRGYFDFAIGMALAFGLVFELPIVILALTALGIVTPKFLNTYRRHAVVLCVVGAAFVTPGADPTSLFALAVPLYLLFEISVVLSTVIYRRRLRREREAAAEALAAEPSAPAPLPPADEPAREPVRLMDGTPDA